MKHFLIFLLVFALTSPVQAEPLVNLLNSPAAPLVVPGEISNDIPPDEIHAPLPTHTHPQPICKLPRPKTRKEKLKAFSKKYGSILMRLAITGVEVAGSLAQIIQTVHH